jgi:hypothetical protein
MLRTGFFNRCLIFAFGALSLAARGESSAYALDSSDPVACLISSVQEAAANGPGHHLNTLDLPEFDSLTTPQKQKALLTYLSTANYDNFPINIHYFYSRISKSEVMFNLVDKIPGYAGIPEKDVAPLLARLRSQPTNLAVRDCMEYVLRTFKSPEFNDQYVAYDSLKWLGEIKGSDLSTIDAILPEARTDSPFGARHLTEAGTQIKYIHQNLPPELGDVYLPGESQGLTRETGSIGEKLSKPSQVESVERITANNPTNETYLVQIRAADGSLIKAVFKPLDTNHPPFDPHTEEPGFVRESQAYSFWRLFPGDPRVHVPETNEAVLKYQGKSLGVGSLQAFEPEMKTVNEYYTKGSPEKDWHQFFGIWNKIENDPRWDGGLVPRIQVFDWLAGNPNKLLMKDDPALRLNAALIDNGTHIPMGLEDFPPVAKLPPDLKDWLLNLNSVQIDTLMAKLPPIRSPGETEAFRARLRSAHDFVISQLGDSVKQAEARSIQGNHYTLFDRVPFAIELSKVHGFSDAELSKLKLVFKNGKILGADGKPFDTHGKKHIFIMDDRGEVYGTPDDQWIDGKPVKHPSLSRGKPVAAAGELEIREGKLVYYNDSSGNYSVPRSGSRQFEARLREAQIQVRPDQVHLQSPIETEPKAPLSPAKVEPISETHQPRPEIYRIPQAAFDSIFEDVGVTIDPTTRRIEQRRTVIDVKTDKFIAKLQEEFGGRMSMRDKPGAATSTDYLVKFRSTDASGTGLRAAKIRLRAYKNLKDGQTAFTIDDDPHPDYVKLVNAPPEQVFTKFEFKVQDPADKRQVDKPGIIMARSDIDLLLANKQSYELNKEQVVQRAKALAAEKKSPDGKVSNAPANDPRDVDDMVSRIRKIYDTLGSAESLAPTSRVTYERVAYVIQFPISPKSGKEAVTSIPVQMTIDKNILYRDLQTGKSVSFSPDNRVIEVKIPTEWYNKLEKIRALPKDQRKQALDDSGLKELNEFVKSYQSLEIVPGSEPDRGKAAQAASQIH